MKRIFSIFMIASLLVLILSGCTVLPASEETGVGPREYAEMREAEELKKENEGLKTTVEDLNTEIEKIKKDYLELSKNKDSIDSKLSDAEAKLDILENDGVPKFISEETDKNSIMAYLNNNKKILDKSLRGIEIIDNSAYDKVLFYTTGYGESFNQIFIWETGEEKPELIDNASFSKKGNISAIDEKFLLIDTGNNEEYKILDIENNLVVNTFYSVQNVFLLPDTSTFIIQKPETNLFELYDFISLKEQEIDLDYKSRFTSFKRDDASGDLIFEGYYNDENEVSYIFRAAVKIDILKEKYDVLTLNQALELKENGAEEQENNTVEAELEEANDGANIDGNTETGKAEGNIQ